MSKRKESDESEYDSDSVEEKRARLEEQGVDILQIEEIVSGIPIFGLRLALQLSVEQIFDLCSVSQIFNQFCQTELTARFWKSVLLGDILYDNDLRDEYIKCIETDYTPDSLEMSNFKSYLDSHRGDLRTRYKRAYSYTAMQSIHLKTYTILMGVSKIKTTFPKSRKRFIETPRERWELRGVKADYWETNHIIDPVNCYNASFFHKSGSDVVEIVIEDKASSEPFAVSNLSRALYADSGTVISGDARMVIFDTKRDPRREIQDQWFRDQDCEIIYSRETRIGQPVDAQELKENRGFNFPWGVRVAFKEKMSLRSDNPKSRGLPLYNRDWKFLSRLKNSTRRVAIYDGDESAIANTPKLLDAKPILRIADSFGSVTRFALAESSNGTVFPFDTNSRETLCEHSFDKDMYLDWLKGPLGAKSNSLCPICKG